MGGCRGGWGHEVGVLGWGRGVGEVDFDVCIVGVAEGGLGQPGEEQVGCVDAFGRGGGRGPRVVECERRFLLYEGDEAGYVVFS